MTTLEPSGTRRLAITHPVVYKDPTSTVTGGRWPVDLTLALGLRSTFEVDLVAFGPPGRYPMGERATLVLVEPHRAGLPIGPMEEALSWDLPSALEGSSAVLVQQPFSRSGEVACLVARALGKPVVVLDSGARSSTVGRSLGLLSLVEGVICHSAYGASLLAPGTASTVVMGGVDHHAFSPPPDPPARTHLLFVGPTTAHSGLSELVRALPAALPLVVCPEPGSDAGQLADLADGRDVRVLDATGDRLVDLYRSAWATVVPPVVVDASGEPRREPVVTSVCAVESMACATPVVVSDLGALPELVEDGRTGCVAASVAEAVEQAARLAADPALADRLGAEARREVVARFTMEAVADAVAGLVDGIVDGLVGPGERAQV